MCFIPTKFHAPLDYIVGAVLRPWIFQYSDDNAATVISIVLGIGLIAYSLLTNYELGVWKVALMALHNLIDIVTGALLAVSPWLFGFADDGAHFWLPFVVIGVAANLPRPDDQAAGRLQLRQVQHADDGVGLEFVCAAGGPSARRAKLRARAASSALMAVVKCPSELWDTASLELRRGNTTRACKEEESNCSQLTPVRVMSSMPQRVPSRCKRNTPGLPHISHSIICSERHRA